MKFATSIPAAPPDANPNAGARTLPGKTNNPESVMTDAPDCKAEKVKAAPEDKGVARKCIDIQVQGDGGSNSPNGNPKKRAKSWHGVEEPKT